MSDSDYLISIGCSYLVRGDIPSNYGDDGPAWLGDEGLYYEALDSYCKKKDVHLFDSFEEAIEWAKKNSDRIVIRFPFETYHYRGYISKPIDGSDLPYDLFTQGPHPLFVDPKEFPHNLDTLENMNQTKASKQRKEEIIHWLYKSKYVRRNDNTTAFSLKKEAYKAKVRLENSQVVDLIDWLTQEGIIYIPCYYQDMFSPSYNVGGYYISSYSHPEDEQRSFRHHFSRIEDISWFPYGDSNNQNKVLNQEIIKSELSKYTNVSENQDTIIYPEDCVLAWKDLKTGLYWDVARIFNETQINGQPILIYNILNKLNYAGFCDWRMPTLYELETIVTKEKTRELHIKKPLAATANVSCWGDSEKGNLDKYAKNFKNNCTETDRYYGRNQEKLGAYTLCVRGKLENHSN